MILVELDVWIAADVENKENDQSDYFELMLILDGPLAASAVPYSDGTASLAFGMSNQVTSSGMASADSGQLFPR